MIFIRFRFPAGRFHATPWGSHVNEGEVEWPPSPWRLFRALLSVGFTHLQWATLPDQADLLIENLSGCHPAYALPAGVPVHTRHYMPVHEGTKVKSAKIFDTSIRVADDQAMWMRFDVDLSTSEKTLLKSLLDHLSFLGRAESWIDAELRETCSDDSIQWIEPSEDAMPMINTRLVRVLSTQRHDVYQSWRNRALLRTARTQAASKGKEKLTATQHEKLEESFPTTVSECLLMTTSALQNAGWSQPPGSMWIDYNIPQPSNSRVPTQHSSRTSTRRPHAALLSLSSDTVRGSTLPKQSLSVFIGEHLHQACVAKLTKLSISDQELSIFTGRDQAGEWIHGHKHTHFIPLCLKGSRDQIDHVLVYADCGFGNLAQQAIANVDSIYSDGLPKTHVTLLGFGEQSQVASEIRAISRQDQSIFLPGRRFQSVTPFVASRHLKPKSSKYTLEHNLVDECHFRNLPPARITSDPVRNQGRFRIARVGQGRKPPQSEGWFLTIEFEEALKFDQLPLCLGYASHFGLGLFTGVDL